MRNLNSDGFPLDLAAFFKRPQAELQISAN